MRKTEQGVVMAEVIVAFAVMMLCILMVTVCIQLAGSVQKRVKDGQKELQDLEIRLYQANLADDTNDAIWDFISDDLESGLPEFELRVREKTIKGILLIENRR